MVFIGIDPGKKGGIAKIFEDGDNRNVTVEPFSEEALISLASGLESCPTPVYCVLEKVNAMPGQGVVSMFNFGKNFGFIQGVLQSRGIAYELVPPQKWKKMFSVTSDKNTSISVAKKLFPKVNLFATPRCKKEHDGMAEALLMAEYARRVMK